LCPRTGAPQLFPHHSKIVSSAFIVLEPDGDFEIQAPQMPIACINSTLQKTALKEWNRVICLAGNKLGRSVTNCKNHGKYMEQAGFVDVVEKHS